LSIEEQSEKNKENLSERCRIALEKNFGFPIPLPKCVKKTHEEEQFTVFGGKQNV